MTGSWILLEDLCVSRYDFVSETKFLCVLENLATLNAKWTFYVLWPRISVSELHSGLDHCSVDIQCVEQFGKNNDINVMGPLQVLAYDLCMRFLGS